MKESVEQRIVVEGQHVVMTRNRRKIVLPNTSPSSKIDIRSKNPDTKVIRKDSKLKSHTEKELKDKVLRKAKVVELLQEESLEILSLEDHQNQKEYLQPDLSIDAGYDEADTFNPASTKSSKEIRTLYLPSDSMSAEENILIDEQTEVGSPSKEDQEERYVFYGKPQAHRPITRSKNKLRLRFKLMENPKLKDLVINIDDTPIKEEPPKPKMVKVSKPRKYFKVKVDKEQGLKLLAQIANSMP